MNPTSMNPARMNCISKYAMCVVAIFAVTFAFSLSSYGADAVVQVELNSKNTGPRTIESLTERGILRDYRFAWTSIAQALEFNTLDPLDGHFAGNAQKWLKDTIISQQRFGLSQRYLDQNHRLDAVFYAPEGDVVELHDTAEYRLQVSDGNKVIQDEHVVIHFVVLMTPGADRWVIRQLQAVPQF